MSTTSTVSVVPDLDSPVVDAPRRGADLAPIGFTQLVRVEAVKMVNTRSGFWLATSIVVLAALATAGVLVFGSESAVNYGNFAAAVGMPTAIILPVMAILTVTSEYSQRTALTTFALVPHRGRVVAAKAVLAVLVGVVAIRAACGIGALGNLLGAAVHGIDPIWEFGVVDLVMVVLANVIGMLMGFTLGVLLRNSPAAVVAYFVYSFVLPNVWGALAFYRPSFEDVWPWVDLFYTTTSLYERTPSGVEWAQLAVSLGLWLVLPLAVGLRQTLRAEVK
jgi:ABC-2 type transport system permease protein